MKYLVATEDEFGMAVVQEDNFNTFEDAQQEVDECIARWGDDGQVFYAIPYSALNHEEIKEQEPKQYAHPNSIDGWEDLYPTMD